MHHSDSIYSANFTFNILANVPRFPSVIGDTKGKKEADTNRDPDIQYSTFRNRDRQAAIPDKLNALLNQAPMYAGWGPFVLACVQVSSLSYYFYIVG